MARTGEMIDFRRAFVWLLCGVLLPSVALVAFGVVAVANERAAVEQRLAAEYDAKLRTLERELDARLDAAAQSAVATLSRLAQQPLSMGAPAAAGGGESTAAQGDGPVSRAAGQDALLASFVLPDSLDAKGLGVQAQRAAGLPAGAHFFSSIASGPSPGLYALVRYLGVNGVTTGAARIDVQALAAEVSRLPGAHGVRERAQFSLAVADPSAALPTLKRIVSEVAPGRDRASRVARLQLGPPLEGFTLDAALPGDDPAAAAAFRNRTLYIVLLVLLYTSIGLGFGLTLREMHRGAQLSQLKTDFVANISHELRTPLTSVRLFAETLQSGRAKGQEVQECLDLLSAEAQRLSTLVEKLLDWSRLEGGKRALDREPVEVPALFDHVAEIFRAQQLGTTYSTSIEGQLPRIEVDRDALAQVVLNLLHNAVKYTPEDGRRIELRARRAGRSVAIEVQDNGPGVRPHERKKIFERFYRADDLLSRRTEGTGLGLAIAKRIVEGHGGKIELETKVGHGSTFRVLLPVAAG